MDSWEGHSGATAQNEGIRKTKIARRIILEHGEIKETFFIRAFPVSSASIVFF